MALSRTPLTLSHSGVFDPPKATTHNLRRGESSPWFLVRCCCLPHTTSSPIACSPSSLIFSFPLPTPVVILLQARTLVPLLPCWKKIVILFKFISALHLEAQFHAFFFSRRLLWPTSAPFFECLFVHWLIVNTLNIYVMQKFKSKAKYQKEKKRSVTSHVRTGVWRQDSNDPDHRGFAEKRFILTIY